MNYKIERHEIMHLTGLATRVGTDKGRGTADIVEFWDMIRRDGTLSALCDADDSGGRFECLGVYLDDYDMLTHEYTYLVAVQTPAEYRNVPEGCVDVQIQAGTWAVFECRGAVPASIQSVWNRIFREWFPASGRTHRPGPRLEAYLPGDFQSPDYYCEVWVPVEETTDS